MMGNVMSETWIDEGRPGLGRLNFFLGKVGIMAAMMAAVTWLGPESSWLRVIGLVLSFVSFALDVMRLRNIGVSQWYAGLRFVPYVNLLYTIFLQSAQGGWIETRRLDKAGRTLIVFQLALLVLMIFMLLKMRVAVPYFV